MTTWILVADQSRARLFEQDGGSGDGLREIEGFIHPAARLRPSELDTDRRGSFVDTEGFRVSGEPKPDHKHKEAERFASEVSEALEQARNKQRFQALIVAAPPLFLGALREKFPAPLKALVRRELHKDYTRHKAADIQRLVFETSA